MTSNTITTYGLESQMYEAMDFLDMSLTTSQATSANYAYFVPVMIERPVTVYKIGWINGSLAGPGGNIDVGIYTPEGTRLASSGSQVQGSVSVFQIVDIADVALGAGVYLLAIVADAAATFEGIYPTGQDGLAFSTFGHKCMNNAFPLPATATFDTAGTRLFYLSALVDPNVS